MATKSELATTLLRRFKGVPNVEQEDAEDWVERALLEHGYQSTSDVPGDDQLLILLYSEWDGVMQIALRTAYYFEYKDSEESVDKRMVSETYRNMADKLWQTYERKKNEAGRVAGPRFSIMGRADRPPSTN
jgi:hypothetical protein